MDVSQRCNGTAFEGASIWVSHLLDIALGQVLIVERDIGYSSFWW